MLTINNSGREFLIEIIDATGEPAFSVQVRDLTEVKLVVDHHFGGHYHGVNLTTWPTNCPLCQTPKFDGVAAKPPAG